MAAESAQRFTDGHQPALTPGYLPALQRKVCDTAVQRLIDRKESGQDSEEVRFEESLRRQGDDVTPSTESVPHVQRQDGEVGGGMGGAGVDEGVA